MTWMPWIVREGSLGFHGDNEDALDEREWERLEAILTKHSLTIKDEDSSGVQIELLPADKLVLLHEDLRQAGFGWLDEEDLVEALRSTHDASYEMFTEHLLQTSRAVVN
jgi:hypothetical protein